MFNIVRIDGQTQKKHTVHPGYETQDGAKNVLKDMVVAHLKQRIVVEVFELSFKTTLNGDIFLIEDAAQIKNAA